MTRHGRHRVGAAAILIGGGLATLALCALSFDPLFVTGGTAPAIISGPGLVKWLVGGGAMLLLAGAAWGAGRRRWLFLLLWGLFLATSTHRLVERADGAVADIWLWVPVQRLPASADETRRCHIATWHARCDATTGGGFSTISPFPIVPLYPGKWTDPA